MTKEEAIISLRDNPIRFAWLHGFTKLRKDIHNDWMKRMLNGDEQEMTLLAHRGSYKTTCVSVVLAIIMITMPNIRILFIRKTDSNVKDIIRQVRNILLSPKTSVIVQAIWGIDLKLTKNTDNELSTNLNNDNRGESQLVGVGLGASITGKHFDRIFTDDIVTKEDRTSRADRDKTKTAYQELVNIINRDSKRARWVNTGTPWHKEDCIELHMRNKEKHDYHETGLISDEEIEDIRSRMLPSLFAANYELKHIAGEDVLFTTPQTGADAKLVYNGIAHVDSAFYGDDYTAFTMMCKHGENFYVLGKIWRKHVEDCYPMIGELYQTHLATKLYNETNADKGMVAKELRQMGLKVVTYNESMNKHVKISTYLYSIWKNVIFVEGTDEEYINQICDYTEDAEHDDAPDSCACCARLLSKKSNDEYKPLWN